MSYLYGVVVSRGHERGRFLLQTSTASYQKSLKNAISSFPVGKHCERDSVKKLLCSSKRHTIKCFHLHEAASNGAEQLVVAVTQSDQELENRA